MRSPSFMANSRVPSAFGSMGVYPAAHAQSRSRSPARPAGQLVQQESGSNVYHNVAFYDVNQNPVNDIQTTTSLGPFYNEYGYPIDAQGNPQVGSAPASWAQLGSRGQAWTQPGTGYLLDSNGAVMTTAVPQNASTAGGGPVLSPDAYNAIGAALNTTGSAISSALASNNQLQIAQLNAQTQTAIANLTQQSQQAAAAGNLALARQNSADANALRQFQLTLQARQSSSTMLYVVIGAVALLGVGALVFLSRPQSSSTTVSRSRTHTNPMDSMIGHARHVGRHRRSRRSRSRSRF